MVPNNIKYKFQPTDILFVAVALICLLPFISSPIALIFGFILTYLGITPAQLDIQKLTKKLLSYSIIGLGFGIQLDQAIAASQQGLGLIISSIFGTLIMGYLLTKVLRIDQKTGHLIASGTAICGGSAIAAVAPAINAKDGQTSLALATVFILNSIALFIFPAIGSALNMSQLDFGTWAAIAIHDTAAVVGAAGAYGDEALKIATTLKLARALWIIPLAFISALLFKGDNKKAGVPLFIVFYCLAILFAYFVPGLQVIYDSVFTASKRLLVVCLFLIGSGITLQNFKSAGFKSLLLGVMLWLMIGVSSLIFILF